MFRRYLNTTFLISLTVMAANVAQATPSLIPTTKLYLPGGGFVEIGSTTFTSYQRYSPVSTSISALTPSTSGSDKPSTVNVPVGPAGSPEMNFMASLGLPATILPTSSGSASGVVWTSSVTPWATSTFWGYIRRPVGGAFKRIIDEDPSIGGTDFGGNQGGSGSDSEQDAGSKAEDNFTTTIVVSDVPAPQPPTASVPEPGTLGLLTAGLLGFLLLRRAQIS